ncbi:MAG: hypothetical protein V8S34_02060 [Lawsonibacter sp.]
MIDASQPFLEDKKQNSALDGGDDPVRLILRIFPRITRISTSWKS